MMWLLASWLPERPGAPAVTLVVSYDPPLRAPRIAPPSVRAADLSRADIDWLTAILVGEPR